MAGPVKGRQRVVIIDNYDSFTYNIAQYVSVGGGHATVLSNSVALADIRRADPTHLILSPGPGTVVDPTSYGVSMTALDHFVGRVPVLGVCLGHQTIGAYFGAGIRQLEQVRHGHVSTVRVERPIPLFDGLTATFTAMRYHSLAVDPVTLPESLEVTALACDDGVVMGLSHRRLPVYGVQFHPESIGTPQGQRIVSNFLAMETSRWPT